MSRLEEIIKLNEDSRELAEYAGITLTLEQYDYLIEQAERVDGLEERNYFLERAHRTNINIAEHALEERDRYKQALEEIVESKENNYGWEYPDVVDEIATDALAGGTE